MGKSTPTLRITRILGTVQYETENVVLCLILFLVKPNELLKVKVTEDTIKKTITKEKKSKISFTKT